MTKLSIYVNSFQLQAGAEPFRASGRVVSRLVISGDVELPDGEYVTRVTVHDDEHEHPLADVPFIIGMGYWVWMSPEAGEENEE